MINKKTTIRTLIRIGAFFGIYFPLFILPYILKLNSLTPIIVLIAFFASKPITKAIVSKWFPNLNE